MNRGLLFGLGAFWIDFLHQQVEESEKRKEILNQWNASKHLPRKKKKRVRKRLLVEWSIANLSTSLPYYYEKDIDSTGYDFLTRKLF